MIMKYESRARIIYAVIFVLGFVLQYCVNGSFHSDLIMHLCTTMIVVYILLYPGQKDTSRTGRIVRYAGLIPGAALYLLSIGFLRAYDYPIVFAAAAYIIFAVVYYKKRGISWPPEKQKE